MSFIKRSHTQSRYPRRCWAIVVIASCGAGGCARDEPQDTPTDAGVTRTASRGPVDVTLSAVPATVAFEQHARLQVDVLADQDVTVLESEYDKALTEGDRRFEYRVVRAENELARPTEGGRLRWTWRFELKFFLPGDYELPPARVSFVDLSAVGRGPGDEASATGPADVQTVETEPLMIVVLPLEGTGLSEAELRNIPRLDPVELPATWSAWWWLAPVVAVTAVIMVVILLRRLRGSRPDVVVQIPPHEWARRQLATLVAQDLIARGLVQEYYYRISSIVRGYLERRFGVSAPEMTTEEFLASAAGDRRFGSDMTGELKRFLSACDLVKYARHEPGREEPDTVLRAAGDFIERTRERVSPVVDSRALTGAQLRAG